MNYIEFKEEVKNFMCQEVGMDQEVDVELTQIRKNNGIMWDALHVLNPRKQCSPTIYLRPWFEKYEAGTPFSKICRDILLSFQEAIVELPIEIDEITRYETMKDRIIIRIIHYEKNKEQLAECPCIPFLDLAISFRWLGLCDSMGIASALVSNREMEEWEVSLQELFLVALENTRRIFPEQIRNLKDVLEGLVETEVFEDLEEPVEVYVLTNERGINGATAMLYTDVIRNFSLEMGRNIYILPSSIHEVLLIPEQEHVIKQDLKRIVCEANCEVVAEGEILSYEVYYYDQEKDMFKIIDS